MATPSTQYAQTSDGVHIAYWVAGSGPPLVCLPYHPNISWLAEQKIEEAQQYLDRLAQFYTVIALDFRGTGMSDDGVADRSLAALVRDVEAVADAEQLKQFTLFGAVVSGPIAVAYAAAHPERVSHLVLWATGASWPAYIGTRGRAPRAVGAIDDLKIFADTISLLMLGRSLASEVPRYAQLVQETKTIARWLEVMESRHDDDVSEQLSAVGAPTLVLAREDTMVPMSAGKELAAGITGARFVILSGESVLPHFGDANAVIEAVREFTGNAATGDETSEAGAFRTILFTDVEASTQLTDRFGDAKARDLLREHERLTRDALAAHGGTEIKTMGDGFMASFTSASSALDAAIAMQQAITAHFADSETPIRIRVGINAGEPIEEDDDLYGASVIRAARVMSEAQGGEILVSNVVRELVEGKEYLFSDRGAADLKGFEEAVRLFEVQWQS